jgi:hypothetical protein
MVGCLHTPGQRIPSQSPYFSLLFFAFHLRVSWSPVSRLPPLALPFFFFAGAVPFASAVVGVAAADAAAFVAGVAFDGRNKILNNNKNTPSNLLL